jgi:hypothetical protein
MKRDYATCISCRFYGYWYEWLWCWVVKACRTRISQRHRAMTCRRRDSLTHAVSRRCVRYQYYKKVKRNA